MNLFDGNQQSTPLTQLSALLAAVPRHQQMPEQIMQPQQITLPAQQPSSGGNGNLELLNKLGNSIFGNSSDFVGPPAPNQWNPSSSIGRNALNLLNSWIGG